MKYPSYCCQKCGELIGWLGRANPFHKCKGKHMTKDEALNMALEALEDFADAIKYEHEQDEICRRACCDELSYSQHSENCKAIKVITAIKEALAQPAPPATLPAPVQEPVAWRTFDGEGGYEYRAYDMNEDYAEAWSQRNPKHKGWVEPLYTTPSQRTWVGLTDEEMQECIKTADYNQGQYKRTPYWAHLSTSIEAKLKEKNNG